MGEVAPIPDHTVLLPGFDEETLGCEVDVGSQWYDPPGKGDDITVPGFVVDSFHDFGYIFGDGGVITILSKGFKVCLRGVSVEVGWASNCHDAVEFVCEVLITSN